MAAATGTAIVPEYARRPRRQGGLAQAQTATGRLNNLPRGATVGVCDKNAATDGLQIGPAVHRKRLLPSVAGAGRFQPPNGLNATFS